jgi:putative PIG3 family NAD(P)H quinone oxidoreductase
VLAIEISKPGGPEVLEAVERPKPELAPGEVLIKVEAAGVNRPDVMQRMGHYPPPPGASDIPGLEVAGVIVKIAHGVGEWRIGDRVCALVAGGGYAEFCVAPAPQCLAVPRGMNFVQAAAIPETFFTVWTNVFERGRLQAGESMLVHGGSSGIGTAAIQLMAARGHRVFTTAGSPGKCAACEALGAERAINYKTEDFVQVVKEATKGKGVDVILDMVGGEYIQRNMSAAALWGRIVNIAYQSGMQATVNFAPLLMKRLSLLATTLRARSNEEKGAIRDALLREVWPLIVTGRIKPVVDRTFPLAEAGAAHVRMAKSEHIGKILLTI